MSACVKMSSVSTVLHVVFHGANLYHICTQPSTDLNCYLREYFRAYVMFNYIFFYCLRNNTLICKCYFYLFIKYFCAYVVTVNGLVKLAVSSGAVSSVLLYCCTAPLLAVASSGQWAVDCCTASSGQQWAVDCCTAGRGQQWAVYCWQWSAVSSGLLYCWEW